MYVVRKGARHPNAAKLLALWITGAEANRIIEKSAHQENSILAAGAIARTVLKKVKEKKTHVVDWFASPESLKKLRWLRSPEGRKYRKAISKAQRKGQ